MEPAGRVKRQLLGPSKSAARICGCARGTIWASHERTRRFANVRHAHTCGMARGDQEKPVVLTP
jgi:hypothetical protein